MSRPAASNRPRKKDDDVSVLIGNLFAWVVLVCRFYDQLCAAGGAFCSVVFEFLVLACVALFMM